MELIPTKYIYMFSSHRKQLTNRAAMKLSIWIQGISVVYGSIIWELPQILHAEAAQTSNQSPLSLETASRNFHIYIFF